MSDTSSVEPTPGTASTDATIVATRMWLGGPMRQMAALKVSGTFIPVTPVQNLTFAGRYVCDRCLEPSKGVYRQDDGKASGNRRSSEGPEWICDSCLDGKARVACTPEQNQAQKAELACRLALARLSTRAGTCTCI